jgi:hypothetical protein
MLENINIPWNDKIEKGNSANFSFTEANKILNENNNDNEKIEVLIKYTEYLADNLNYTLRYCEKLEDEINYLKLRI